MLIRKPYLEPARWQTTVEVRLGSKVTRVVRTLDGVDITAGGVTDHFDFVVITLDGPHTSLIHVS